MNRIFNKADETETAINRKAALYAFVFLEIAVIGYCIAKKITTGEFPETIFFIGIMGSLIFLGIKLYETKRLADTVVQYEK